MSEKITRIGDLEVCFAFQQKCVEKGCTEINSGYVRSEGERKLVNSILWRCKKHDKTQEIINNLIGKTMDIKVLAEAYGKMVARSIIDGDERGLEESNMSVPGEIEMRVHFTFRENYRKKFPGKPQPTDHVVAPI